MISIILFLLVAMLCVASIVITNENVKSSSEWKWYDNVMTIILVILGLQVIWVGHVKYLEAENKIAQEQIDSLNYQISYLDRLMDMEDYGAFDEPTIDYEYAMLLDTVTSVDTLYVPIKRKKQVLSEKDEGPSQTKN
jgi:hypothetical protein